MLQVNGLYGHIRRNTVVSGLLLGGFTLLIAAYWWAACLLWSAWAFAGDVHPATGSATSVFGAIAIAASRRALEGWYVPVLGTGLWFAFACFFYGAIIRSQTGARPIERRDAPRLHSIVERMSIAAGLPMPRVEIMETPALNAYASGLGPDDATIAVTRGLLDSLEPHELEAVVAHEMAHIKNRDVRLMVVAHIFAGAITLAGSLVSNLRGRSRASGVWGIGDFAIARRLRGLRHRGDQLKGPVLLGILAAVVVAAVILVLAHAGAIMSRLAISRSREFLADAGAVELTRNPDALISALAKIAGRDQVPGVSENMASMMISSSFDEGNFLETLFSTHPPVADRIAALATFAGGRASAERRTPEIDCAAGQSA
jgi:heat shock protein HtpX